MCEKICWRIQPCFSPLRDGDTKPFCIPKDNDGGEQVQPCNAEVLAFRVAVSDFTLPPNP